MVCWKHEGRSHVRAYGSRSLVPVREPMTEETVFDATSLTKSHRDHTGGDAPAEAGVWTGAVVSRYLPEFRGGGRNWSPCAS